MADLKTTYKDDVLDTSANTRRKFNMITNEDGTVSFEDVTEYSQVGDSFGGEDINNTNAAINELNNALQNLYLNTSYKQYTDITIDGTVYNGETGILWIELKYKSLDRSFFLGFVHNSTVTQIWNRYINKNNFLVSKNIDGTLTEFTSVTGNANLVNKINLYGIDIYHNCNGISHNIALRGTVTTELVEATKYTANIPEWCISNGGGTTVLLGGNYSARVYVKEENLEFIPVKTIPVGTWVIGTCTIINLP